MNKNCVLFQNSDILDKDKIETYQETITRYYIFSGWQSANFCHNFLTQNPNPQPAKKNKNPCRLILVKFDYVKIKIEYDNYYSAPCNVI